MNDTIRELGGAGYVGVLKEELSCKITFVDGQLYQKHALLLYRANDCVCEQLPSIEYKLNANTTCRHEIAPVSEREFIIHLYMDNLNGIENELPLSDILKTALDRSKTWRLSRTIKDNASFGGYGFDSMNDILSSREELFSEELDTQDTHNAQGDDPYSNLFDMEDDDLKKKEENSDQTTDVMDDLMGFFNEDEQ